MGHPAAPLQGVPVAEVGDVGDGGDVDRKLRDHPARGRVQDPDVGAAVVRKKQSKA